MKGILLASLFVTAPLFGDDQPQISTSGKSIVPGGSVAITWQGSGSGAFLLGFGKVPLTGKIEVSPAQSTAYVLVTEKDGVVKSANAYVAVEGERGDSVFPDPDDFPAGVAAEKPNSGYTDFLDTAFKTLQDKLKFSVRGDFLPSRAFDVLFTNRAVKSDLLRPADRGVRQRRIAYAVRVDQPAQSSSATIRFAVKTLIDYQLQGESKWRPDPDEELAHAASDSLIRQLVAKP